MKKIAIYVFLGILVFPLHSQTIEKVFQTDEIVRKTKAPIYESPFGIYADEIEQKIEIMNGNWDGSNEIHIGTNQEIIPKDNVQSAWGDIYIEMGNYYIGSSASYITIQTGKEIINEARNVKSGISFILKKGDGYIVYYVNDKGIPGAVDTEGNIYGNTEAMEYLKTYDKAKYEASRMRAEELGFTDSFDKADVLMWGQTYYSTAKILKAFWKPETYLYPNFGYMIQYDIQGNGYMADYDSTGTSSDITIVSPNGKQLSVIPIHNESAILRNHSSGQSFTASTYVGFGGNIYYYIAGKEYTEVFRIRRTWGEPDLYAMAVNGYTEDSYGTYVKETISKLSKAELRLLRNTLFALYGYTFKSEDLKSHFDKQVWYTDGNKTMNDIVLPAHRQKLLELVQEEESRR